MNTSLKNQIHAGSYTKNELAHMYMPNSSYETRMRTFRRWIKRNTALYQALKEVGYNDYCKVFTPKQVTLIFSYLGEP